MFSNRLVLILKEILRWRWGCSNQWVNFNPEAWKWCGCIEKLLLMLYMRHLPLQQSTFLYHCWIWINILVVYLDYHTYVWLLAKARSGYRGKIFNICLLKGLLFTSLLIYWSIFSLCISRGTYHIVNDFLPVHWPICMYRLLYLCIFCPYVCPN